MGFEKDKVQLFYIYHEASKINEITQAEIGQSVTNFYRHPLMSQAVRKSFTVHPYKKQIKLNNSKISGDIGDIISSRRSVRSLKKHDLTLDELSSLFGYTYGITGEMREMIKGVEHVQPLRAVPSAGATYPLDMYLVLFDSADLDAGIYHYNVADHSLELLKEGDFREEIIRIMPNQYCLDIASGLLLLSAHFLKATLKYLDRGYRFVLFDAGHLMQNVYLSLSAMGLGCYACGGFFDDDFNELVGLDGKVETALYTAVIGKPNNAK